jgi:biotin carboxyl carrier protein
MYKAIVGEQNFEIIKHRDGLLIDGSELSWDIVSLSEGHFHLLINHQSYSAELVKAEASQKTFTFKINGKLYTVELKDKFDLLLDKMGMNNGTSGRANSIKAPMPGLIIDLRVKEGDTVNPGDPLIILEAMKMENMIKASGENVVKAVKVKKGDNVEKNQVLIEF